MGFMDKVKTATEQAAAKAQEGVEGVTTKRDLSSAYGELGRVAYTLIQRGEIEHAELAPLAERVNELEAKAAAAH
jgi:hypothetical protein